MRGKSPHCFLVEADKVSSADCLHTDMETALYSISCHNSPIRAFSLFQMSASGRGKFCGGCGVRRIANSAFCISCGYQQVTEQSTAAEDSDEIPTVDLTADSPVSSHTTTTLTSRARFATLPGEAREAKDRATERLRASQIRETVGHAGGVTNALEIGKKPFQSKDGIRKSSAGSSKFAPNIACVVSFHLGCYSDGSDEPIPNWEDQNSMSLPIVSILVSGQANYF